MSINLFLAGLLLTCLKDQPNCIDDGKNTAWIVKTDKEVCGWDFKDKYGTYLEVRFKPTDFKRYQWSEGDDCPGDTDGKVTCRFDGYSINVTTNTASPLTVDKESLRSLPRIDEIDRRFKALDIDKIKKLDKVYFPDGAVSASELWHKDNVPLWFRSDGAVGGMLPRQLADRLKVHYKDATKINFTSGGPKLYLELKADKDYADVEIRNAAYALEFDQVDGYDYLHYLLFYYRLGSWAGGGDCPNYSIGRRNAVVLRCAKPALDKFCIHYGGDRDTTFWPVMRGPAD